MHANLVSNPHPLGLGTSIDHIKSHNTKDRLGGATNGSFVGGQNLEWISGNLTKGDIVEVWVIIRGGDIVEGGIIITRGD